MLEITKESKYMDLLNQYPLLKTDLVRSDPDFTFLVTQMGKISLWEANLEELSERVDMAVDETVNLFRQLVDTYND